MLPRYRRIIWVVAWLIMKTLLLASFQKHFHVSILVFSCVFWRVTNGKHSSAWQNTNNDFIFSELRALHFLQCKREYSQEPRRKNECVEQELTSYWWKTIFPPTELKVTRGCPLRSHAALPLERPLSLDRPQETKRQRESVMLDGQQKKKEKKKSETHKKGAIQWSSQPLSTAPYDCKHMTNTGKTNISTSLQFNALVHVSVYLVEQHVLCLEMERKSKPKNKTFLDYNIEMEKQVTKLVSHFFVCVNLKCKTKTTSHLIWT